MLRKPRTGGWGFIISQGNRRVEAFEANASTSNNEVELQAIYKALTFFNFDRGYAVIESKGAQWEV
jgi:ribonuclease HI